jgi:ERCC4-type nuclease
MSASIILDNREHGLVAHFAAPHPLHSQPQPLNVGDVHICANSKPILVLERKTYADFQASIMDGRYREQRGRLLAFGAETGARVGYILEGSSAALRPPMTVGSIDKLVARLMYIHGIPVFRTTSVADTARLIETLANQAAEDTNCFAAATVVQRATDGIHVVKRGNTDDPKHFAISFLCLAHGVSTKVAEAWFGAFGSLGAILKASEDELANVRNGAKRVGNAVAKRVRDLWIVSGVIPQP